MNYDPGPFDDDSTDDTTDLAAARDDLRERVAARTDESETASLAEQRANLQEVKDELDGTGFDHATEQVEEDLEALDRAEQLERRLVDLKMTVHKAEEAGLGEDPAVEALRQQISRLVDSILDDPDVPTGEVLDDTPAEAESDLAERHELLTERVRQFDRMGWDAALASAEEELEEFEERHGPQDLAAVGLKSKLARLEMKTVGEDAEQVATLRDRIQRTEGLTEEGAAGQSRAQLAALGEKYDVDLSELEA
jgi:hypothetical protein